MLHSNCSFRSYVWSNFMLKCNCIFNTQMKISRLNDDEITLPVLEQLNILSKSNWKSLPCRNQTSLVNLELLRNGQKVEQVVYGRNYTLRAQITHPDGKFHFNFDIKKPGKSPQQIRKFLALDFPFGLDLLFRRRNLTLKLGLKFKSST